MPTPPCPPPVKAAAILLLVVGAQLLLISAAAVVVVIAVAMVTSGAACGYLVVTMLPISVGVALVKIGATTLWGTTRSARNNGVFCVALGGIGGALGLAAVAEGIRQGVFSRPPALDETTIGFAAAVLFFLNAVALEVAGAMLLATRGRYATWRRTQAEQPAEPADDD